MDGYIGELQGGVTYINTVKDMLEEAENDWPKMLARLQRVRATLLSKKQFLVNLTGDKVWCRGGGDWRGGRVCLGVIVSSSKKVTLNPEPLVRLR